MKKKKTPSNYGRKVGRVKSRQAVRRRRKMNRRSK